MILKTAPDRAQVYRLTNREKQVLYMMANEHTGKSMAEQLNIAVATVRSHRKKLYCKMDVTTSAGAVRKAFENGFLFFAQT
jgi:DNA-binding CsgD family transcriptional regulator